VAFARLIVSSGARWKRPGLVWAGAGVDYGCLKTTLTRPGGRIIVVLVF
jgi:hypothetical protein